MGLKILGWCLIFFYLMFVLILKIYCGIELLFARIISKKLYVKVKQKHKRWMEWE